MINTSKGLFQFGRLPFRISSALAVSSSKMDNVLQHLHYFAVYFNDIFNDNWTKQNRYEQSGLHPFLSSECRSQAENTEVFLHP